MPWKRCYQLSYSPMCTFFTAQGYLRTFLVTTLSRTSRPPLVPEPGHDPGIPHRIRVSALTLDHPA